MPDRTLTYRFENPGAPVAGPIAADPLHAFLVGVGYLIAYVSLDWISFVQPYGSFGITPWNPQSGLSFALVLLGGRRYTPLLFVAPLVANFVLRGFSMSGAYELLYVIAVGTIYAIATHFLLSPRSRFDSRILGVRDTVVLLATAAVSAFAVAAMSVVILWLAGRLAPSDFAAALSRNWVGDAIGIAIVTPSLLVLRHAQHIQWPRTIALLQPLATMAVLWLIFGYDWGSRFQLLYLLFLPVVWIAVSSGIVGACIGLVTTQLALMIALQFVAKGPVNITAYQMVMLVLTATALTIGAVVSERRSAERQIRSMQDAQARFDRLGSMGALSAALAHEINQPLSAAATYARMAMESLASDDNRSSPKLRELTEKTSVQILRAAAVMRRLRDLLQHGKISPQPESPERILRESLHLLEPELARTRIDVTTFVAADLPDVSADRLQIEQVLINILRNAIEAIECDTRLVSRSGQIQIGLRRADEGDVMFSVTDSGPGFASEQLGQGAMPIPSTKSQGLGIGLSLCETIIRSHGGELDIANSADGATVSFTLKEVEKT